MIEQVLLILILIAVGVTAFYVRESLAVLAHIRLWAWKIYCAQFRPPKPPTPKLLKNEVYSHMGKIYFPILLPEVPKTGSPVSRIADVSYNGEIVKTFDPAPLGRCILKLWPDENIEVTVTTRTVDAAGNTSDSSVLTETTVDVFPPPAPPTPELMIDEIEEVEDDEAGEIEIVEAA